MITNVKFFIPESDLIHATCNRGNAHCTYNMGEHTLRPLSSTVFSTNSALISSIAAYSFDKEELPYNEVLETSVESTIGGKNIIK